MCGSSCGGLLPLLGWCVGPVGPESGVVVAVAGRCCWLLLWLLRRGFVRNVVKFPPDLSHGGVLGSVTWGFAGVVGLLLVVLLMVLFTNFCWGWG